jgi:ABC-type multidrug transport system ATPase subunit
MTSPALVSTSPAVRVEHLTVVRGRTRAVDNVSFELHKGTLVGLLGPSGCGKTTLMRSLVGTQVVSSGIITLLGEPAGSSRLRDRVGYVTQVPSVYGDLTVRENLTYFATILGASSEAVERVIADVDLSDHTVSLVGRLSGGERARVSLATALLGSPSLLILDEPTVGLDPLLRRSLWSLFHRLASTGTTLLVSSHVMDEAERCERLLLMRDGRILADTTPAGLLSSTASEDFESAFVALIEGEALGEHGVPRTGGGRALSSRRVRATAGRVLRQLRHDPRTVALLVAVPAVLMGLLAWILHGRGSDFDTFGPQLLGIFPLVVMFLVTSVATLRERTGGTLERLLTMPMGKSDFVLGYAIAFGLVAVIQGLVVSGLCFGPYGHDRARRSVVGRCCSAA